MDNTRSEQAATVEVLTAEVRTLVVGNRQVTMSIYKQLDHVPWREIEPFGRVNAPTLGVGAEVSVVGRHIPSGALVACRLAAPDLSQRLQGLSEEAEKREETRMAWTALPKIVLAGLR